MKKLFLSFAVLAGLSMISCGNKAENAEEAAAVDSAATEVTETAAVAEQVNDSTVVVEEVAATTEVADSAAAAK